MDSVGNVLRSYTWGAAGLISDTGPTDEGIRPRFYFFDVLGNTRHLRKADGTVWQFAYWNPWGSTIIHPDTPFGWQGQLGIYRDTESGLIYMLNRYYHSGIARFVSRDPIAFDGGINVYGYAFGDPINYSDPSGLDPDEDIFDRIGESGSYGASWRAVGRQGFRELQALPQWQPGSLDRRQISGMLNSIPYLGQLKMAVETLSGQDIVGGHSLTLAERLLSGAAILLGAVRPVSAAAKPNKVVVIGETMADVKASAKAYGARYYQAWEWKRPWDAAAEAAIMARNRQWIQTKMREGYTFIDIGIDRVRDFDGRGRSPFYAMEKQQLGNYPRIRWMPRIPARFGK